MCSFYRLPLILCFSLLGASTVYAQVPGDISGLSLWLDAQDASTLTKNGDLISEWENKADVTNPVFQNSGNRQPTSTTDGLNGLPSVYFGGFPFMRLTSNTRETAGEYQLVILAQGEEGGVNWPRLFTSYSGDGGDPWADPNFIVWGPHEDGTPQASDIEIFTGSGTQQVLQNIVIAADSKSLGINQFKGHIGELLLFQRTLTDEEFTSVLDYLVTKWNLDGLYEPPQDVSLTPRLRDLGDALGLTMGSITRDNFYNFPETDLYQKTLGENFGILTTGNAAKYGPLSTGQGTYDFSTLDLHLALAEAYDMQFHGHVFVWHNQLPSWLTSGTWTREQLIDILNDHIDQVGGYLKGKVALWDVVNEPFNGDGTWRSSIWNDTIDANNTAVDQRDYIDMAFQRARQVDPDAKLILNDFSVSTQSEKSDAMYTWAQSMVNRGIPLDGVGFQMHMDGATNYDDFAENMQRFADLGLEIHITELDVRYTVPFTNKKATDQADVYRQVIRRVLDQPAVKTFTMWGFTDAHSWIPTHFPGNDNALILDREYNPKPAFVALQEELMARLTTEAWQTVLAPGSDLSLDLDDDGLSTFLEIALDLDPANPNYETVTPVQLTDGLVTISFTPRSITADIEIRVESSNDLTNWQTVVRRQPGFTEWELIQTRASILIDDTSGAVEVSLENVEAATFVRLRAIQPIE